MTSSVWMQGVVDLLHERDELGDVGLAEPGPGIVFLELLDEPLGVIDADVELAVGFAEKRAGQLAELPRRGPGQPAELSAALAADQAILQVDPHLGVGAFKEALDFAEEGRCHGSLGHKGLGG